METTQTLSDNSAENIILKKINMVDKAPLTNDVLPRILAGEIIERPTVQIMSAKLVDYNRKQRLVLLACDGLKIDHVCCSPELTKMLLPDIKKLIISIVQMDKYAIIEDMVEISEMSWLNVGSEICFTKSLLQSRATLTEGFIENAIEDAKRMRDPIVNICKIQTVKHASESKKRVRLVIYDGREYAYAYLSTQLKQRVRRSLSKRSIVRLDIYKANHLNLNERNSITVFALTVLNQGWIVDFTWNLTTTVPALTNTFIRCLVIGEQWEKPVVKIVKADLFYNRLTSKTQIRVLIYDGIKTCHAILPEYMNYLKDSLDQMPIVRLDKYAMQDKSNNQHERVLVIYEMTGLSLEGHSEVPKQYELRLMRASLPSLDF